MSKGKKIVLWIVSGLLTALFLFAGLSKLLMPAQTRVMFAQVGYAAWFATFIGICETLGAIGLLIPRLAALAAAGLSVIMVGAFVTVATHRQVSPGVIPMVMPVVVLIALVGVAYARVKDK